MEAAAAADHPGDSEDKERSAADGDLEEGEGGDQDDVQLLGRGQVAILTPCMLCSITNTL